MPKYRIYDLKWVFMELIQDIKKLERESQQNMHKSSNAEYEN